nr:uncharacterized protein LOC126056279 [Helicoverpa armigera]
MAQWSINIAVVAEPYFVLPRDDWVKDLSGSVTIISSAAAVLGDFNAKNLAWGSRRTDARGRMVEDWALEAGLVVLNRGSVPTCVRMRGESVVDISFASPALLPRVFDWRVEEGVETYSDHRYIRFDVSAQNPSAPVLQTPSGPRWALRHLDRELLLEASVVQAWVSSPDRNLWLPMASKAETNKRQPALTAYPAMPTFPTEEHP